MKCLLPLAVFGLVLLGGCDAEDHPESADSSGLPTTDAIAAKITAGKAVYESNCAGCHDGGVGGAPKTGDKSAWVGRIEEGTEVLFEKAAQGFEGKKGAMPPRGGNPDISADEIKNAITYMISKVGAGASEAIPDVREPIEKYQ
jgi:cytochrome c5